MKCICTLSRNLAVEVTDISFVVFMLFMVVAVVVFGVVVGEFVVGTRPVLLRFC